MNTRFVKVIALVLCCVSLMACIGSAFADTHEIKFEFPSGKSAYGPAKYFQKGNTKTNWKASYDKGWNAHCGVYLYDKDYNGGKQVTHVEDIQRESGYKTGLVVLYSAACNSSHRHKMVAKRDISQYSGKYDFTFHWGF